VEKRKKHGGRQVPTARVAGCSESPYSKEINQKKKKRKEEAIRGKRKEKKKNGNSGKSWPLFVSEK